MTKIRIILMFVAALTVGCNSAARGKVETSISIADAPEAVQKSASRLVGNGTIEEVEHIVEDGETYYEVEYEKAGVEREAEIAPDGKVLVDGENDD